MEAGQRAQRDRESGQVGLFGEMLDAGGAAPTRRCPTSRTGPTRRSSPGEKELLGF